jgi:hypothetical protein
MRSISDLAAALHRVFKGLVPPTDEELAALYIEDAGDLVDLEMRIRSVDRGRLHRRHF